MKNFLILLIFGFILTACSDSSIDNSYENITNGTQTDGVSSFYFYENKQIQNLILEGSYMKQAYIQPGNKLVFDYSYVYNDVEIIADDEYSEHIRFEIDPNLDSFLYTDSELNATKITFSKVCFCYFRYESARGVAPKGTLEGTKISDTEWEIKMNIVFYGEDRRVIDKSFILSSVN